MNSEPVWKIPNLLNSFLSSNVFTCFIINALNVSLCNQTPLIQKCSSDVHRIGVWGGG